MSIGYTQRPAVTASLTRHDVLKEHELRVEVAFDRAIRVKLINGSAEIFGTEMAPNRAYYLTDCSIPIFTWRGCAIDIEGDCHAYIANETPINQYLNFHHLMQRRRTDAKKLGTRGPVILLAGGTDAGKSSLSATLVSWAARQGEKVTFVDLDLGQGSISIPGVVSAISVDAPLDIEEGFGLYAAPIALFFGDVGAGDNPKLYSLQVRKLAELANQRLDRNADASASGIVINTMGWVDGVGYQLLLEAIQAFNPDHVVVLGHERLYSDLEQEFVKSGLAKRSTLVKLPRSGGVVQRDPQWRRRARFRRIREYFYGKSGDLMPFASVVPFSALQFFKSSSGSQRHDYIMPIGSASIFDPLRPREVSPSLDMLHSVVAVSYASDGTGTIETNVAGFLYITEVNLEKQTLTVLQPCAGQLPSRFVFFGALKYLE